MNNKHKKTTRPYRRITRETVAIHKANIIATGNGTQAVLAVNDDYNAPHDRGYRILKKTEAVTTTEYIDNALQQMSENALQTLSDTIISDDKGLALKASTYTLDHLRGKAVTRTESKNLNISIESVL